MASSNELQRYELYVGVFLNHLWTSHSLCDYFHRLIEGSYITQCRLHPCADLIHDNCSFAILTFDSVSSIDQCMSMRVQIKREHGFIVQRNIRDVPKAQKRVCHYVLVHLDRFDPLFNKENVLNYFGKYGSITQWKILADDRTFLLTFKDYDSVDCIFLDRPHFVNERSLVIKKCFNPDTVRLTWSKHNCLQEEIRNIQASIERSKYLHESQLVKLKKEIEEEIKLEEKCLSKAIEPCIRLQGLQRHLKQELVEGRRINHQLKKQLQETVTKNERIVVEFENQLDQQRSHNKSLEDSIGNFTQIC